MAVRPLHLFEAGIVTEQKFAGLATAPAVLAPRVAERLGSAKHVRIPFNPRDRWLTAARESCRTLADAVLVSLRSGATCAVIGGECTLVAGSMAGALAADPDLLLIYIDAHGDFNTFATTQTHYVSGMVLAHLCGRSVAPLLFPGARKIAEENVALVGTRALDRGEIANLDRSRVTRIPFDAEHSDAPGLVAFARRKPVWIHVDLDVVDPSEVSAVVFPAPGGPSLRELGELLRTIAGVCDIRGFELCGYDPTRDPQQRLPQTLADVLAGLVSLPLSG